MDSMARAVLLLCLCLFVGQVSGSHIPLKMNRTIQNLLQYYKISPKERFNGKPVFSKEPLSGKMEMRRLFMGGILETYEKLISQMLKQHPTPIPQTAVSPQAAASGTIPVMDDAAPAGTGPTLEKELSYILTMVQHLKKHHYQEQGKFLDGLQSLQNIQTENLVVQSKALWELPWLYEEASLLSDNDKAQRRRRRRRQTQRAKNHAKAKKQ